MLRATADIKLPTAIVGSLPRPSWYTENLGSRTFLAAMVNARYREQYVDALGVYLLEQQLAGLDILTDGDCRFDTDVGGQSWTTYPPSHMQGFDRHNPRPVPSSPGKSLVWFPAGHILHDYLESRLLPPIIGPVERGDLQYAALWRTAQRLTAKPVKFGTITAEIIGLLCADHYYKDVRSRILAISDALRAELHELADAGCPVIQIEEPQIHLLAARGFVNEVINPDFMVEVYNNTVKGLRDKTEVWCHSCWGNPSQQRMFAEIQSYKPAIEYFNRCEADVITFESCSSGGIDLEVIGKGIVDKKIAIGVIDHHTLQVERPEEVASPHPTRLEVHLARAPRHLHRLRNGSRRHEPTPRLLQDGCARARDQHRPPRTRPSGGRVSGGRWSLFAGRPGTMTVLEIPPESD